MKRKIILAVLLCLCVSAVFAQTTTSTDNTKTLQFLQGDGVYEAGVMVFLKGLKDSVWTHFDLFITDAKALSAIFMIPCCAPSVWPWSSCGGVGSLK
jgi:hypothetical protein